MDCYFGAQQLTDIEPSAKSAVVMFHIPELGIRFKAPFAAVDVDHGDFASLLALLEFIDSNQKYFSNHTYQIFGHNLSVINQVKGRSSARAEFSHLMQKAEMYRHKYRFSIDWVPTDENSVFDSLLD